MRVGFLRSGNTKREKLKKIVDNLIVKGNITEDKAKGAATQYQQKEIKKG